MQVQMIHRLVHSVGNEHVVYEPGDIYETTPEAAEVLISQGSAVALEDQAPTEAPKKKRVV
jgi:hypothetical protein